MHDSETVVFQAARELWAVASSLFKVHFCIRNLVIYVGPTRVYKRLFHEVWDYCLQYAYR